jgi:hypothetical protein
VSARLERAAAPGLPPAAVAVLDACAIATFVVVGYVAHHGAVHAGGLGRDVGAMLAGWFAAAAVWGLYRRPAPRSLILTWVLGVTLGVVLRAILLGRSPDGAQLAFLLTSLVFGGAFVAGFRLAAAALAARG